MEKSFMAMSDDLKGAQGKIAIVVVSDGKDMGKEPLTAANGLKAQYGDRLCIYTVLVGDNAGGRALLSDLSKVTGCGLAVTADDLASGPQMANFVKTVLLEEMAAPKAEPTKAPLPPLTKRGTWVFKDVKFEFNKATLMKSSYPVLDNIYSILRDNPEIRVVEIQGHTDWIGTDAYNLDLSQRRAQTVMGYLKSKGIAAARMTAKGFGESQPIDTNKTDAGRANNRRVELKPSMH
jgi:OOP family OmpA-OmpF porin